MSEQRARYILSWGREQDLSTFMLPDPVDLGQHILEVYAEDQTVVVFQKTQYNHLVQLSKDEAYRLLVTLQWVFRQEMAQEDGTHSRKEAHRHDAAGEKD